MLRQRRAMSFSKSLAACLTCRLGLRSQDLPREVVTHSPDTRDDLVTEKGVVRCRHQVGKNGTDTRKGRIPANEGIAQAFVVGGDRGGCIRHRHGSSVKLTWLNPR